LDDINDALEKHLRDWLHVTTEEMGGKTVADMLADHERYDSSIDELADKMLGPRRTPLEGGGRRTEEGLVEFLRNGHAHKLQRRQLAGVGGFTAFIVYARDLADLIW